jgi:hypothetical protein
VHITTDQIFRTSRKSGWNEKGLSAIIKPIFKPIFTTLTHEIIKVDLNR